MGDVLRPPMHGQWLPGQLAAIEKFLEMATPVFARALCSSLMADLGGDGATVVVTDTARRGRFIERAGRCEVILDGDHYTIAVVPRADTIEAAAEACAHCAGQLDDCYAHRAGARTLVVHVDVQHLGVFSGVLLAQERGLH